MSGADETGGRDVLREAITAATRWRLPLARRVWRGPSGNWAGVGAGSSIDFQDHRQYSPGDDPRHIHWQAYARTGQLTMKLYRAEVAPYVDVLVDGSASMRLGAAKAARVDELVAFCVECADRAAAPLRLQVSDGASVHQVEPGQVRTGRWRERLQRAGLGASHHATRTVAGGFLSRQAWRPGALKVVISDLLFADDPKLLLGPLASGDGLAVLLVPTLAAEADLPWRGNVDLVNCETGDLRRQRVDEGLAARYRQAYARHFDLWRDACRRRGVMLGRIPSEPPLITALAGEAQAAGVVEPVQ